LQEAKETTLEAIQHVTTDSARLHLLLGKIALSLREKKVFREAEAFLEFCTLNNPSGSFLQRKNPERSNTDEGREAAV